MINVSSELLLKLKSKPFLKSGSPPTSQSFNREKNQGRSPPQVASVILHAKGTIEGNEVIKRENMAFGV